MTTTVAAAEARKDDAGSQTLSRGIRILEFLADHGQATTIPEIVAGVGLHRSIVYRLLRTLEQHRLIGRDDRGLVSLGPRLAALAAGVERDLQVSAAPALRAAAEDLGVTCFLVSLDHAEVITLLSIEPQRSLVTVAQRPGTTHPLGIGAPGKAIASLVPRDAWPAQLTEEQLSAIDAVPVNGFAWSHDEVIPGLQSVAVPLDLSGYVPLAIGVVYIATGHPHADVAERLNAAGTQIRAALDA